MKQEVFALTLGVAGALFAAPTVTNVRLVQDVTRCVDVTYTLSEEAIVTIDLKKDGVSVGPRKLAAMNGDVNRFVKAGSRMASWRPDLAVPDEALVGVTAEVTAWPTTNPPDYLVVDLLFRGERRYYASAQALPYDLTNTLYKTDKLVMRKIPSRGVRWRMGGGKETGNNYDNWRQREVYHYVTFSDNYYASVFPLTQGQYNRLTNQGVSDVENVAFHKPVVWVSYDMMRGSMANGIDWPDTGSTVKPGSVMDQIRAVTGIATFDLPTEAQWEFACRAGTSTGFNNGKNLSGLWDVAPDNICVTGGGPQPVGSKPCNNWGLYDCHGNVNEYCLDWYKTTPYAADSEQTDPAGPTSSTEGVSSARSVRGGNYSTSGTAARSAFRGSVAPATADQGYGFRLVCGVNCR